MNTRLSTARLRSFFLLEDFAIQIKRAKRIWIYSSINSAEQTEIQTLIRLVSDLDNPVNFVFVYPKQSPAERSFYTIKSMLEFNARPERAGQVLGFEIDSLSSLMLLNLAETQLVFIEINLPPNVTCCQMCPYEAYWSMPIDTDEIVSMGGSPDSIREGRLWIKMSDDAAYNIFAGVCIPLMNNCQNGNRLNEGEKIAV